MTKEMAMLEDQIEIVAKRLHAPVIVKEILNGQRVLDGDTNYQLHEILSEYQPDTALLCIAISMQKIAEAFQQASPIMNILYMQCSRLIEDYAPIWLKSARAADLQGDFGNDDLDDDILDLLETIPEDLETLADLMELTGQFLRIKDEDAAQMCEIFEIQAKAHVLIAEEYLMAVTLVTKANQEPSLHPTQTENIVQFPTASKSIREQA